MQTNTEFSIDAQRICARWFSWGGNCSLRSHAPHAELSKYGSGMEELVAAGVVTRQSYNDRGSVEYLGTPMAVEVGKAERLRLARELGFGPKQ